MNNDHVDSISTSRQLVGYSFMNQKAIDIFKWNLFSKTLVIQKGLFIHEAHLLQTICIEVFLEIR